MEREVFVDAGAWIAITDARDKYHKAASELYKHLIEEQINLVTTNLVVAEALCWLLNSSVRSFDTYANLLTSSEWDTILPDLLLPRHWAEYV